jgi:hypothetical protein
MTIYYITCFTTEIIYNIVGIIYYGLHIMGGIMLLYPMQ